MQAITPYRTIKRGEPPTRSKPATFSSRTEPQCKRSIIHALARIDLNGDRTDAAEQTIPSYNGFHAGLNIAHGTRKAYFHMSYNQPPYKSVVNDTMNKLSTTISNKRMPFEFLVGDHTVYILITLLKAENPNKFHNIVPFPGPFHTQCVMMSTIYKRYRGSELGDLLVAAGVIAEGSVDRALKGKHYKRGLLCLRLVYETAVRGEDHALPDRCDKGETEILRDTTRSQKSRTDAHAALNDDDDLESTIGDLFNQVENSDMADYWTDFMSMTDALMHNVHAVHICNWDEYVSSMLPCCHGW